MKSTRNEDASTDTSLLPRDAVTGDPLPPTDHPGYYPGYDILSQQRYWDQATRDVVTTRVDQPPRHPSLHSRASALLAPRVQPPDPPR